MIGGAIGFVIDSLASLFILAALVRFWMQAFQAPSRNPIAHFSMALTDWAVKPLRRVVPGFFKLDWSSLIVAWAIEYLVQLVLVMLVLWSIPGNPEVFTVLLFMSFVQLLRLTIYVFIAAIFVQAIMSWVNPYHPLVPFFNALANPFLKPVRRLIPLIGGVDISPVFVLIFFQLLLNYPITWMWDEAKVLLAQALL